MATSSEKSTTKPAASTTSAKKSVAKKVVVATPASKVITKKTATTPDKKTNVATTKKAVPIPAKKVSAPRTEKPVSKQAATAKSTPTMSGKKNTVTSEERHHMISTAAYFRAKKRGFTDGSEIDNWIFGEAQIDALLNA